jgi:hypothetical protein
VRVQNLLVEEIAYLPEEQTATLAATLWEFGEKRWVSAQPGAEGDALGPVTILDPDSRSLDMPTAKISSFKPYTLPVSKKRVVSHKTAWTVDPETVYALVLPPGFVSDELTVDAAGERRRMEASVSAERNLFYWDLLMGSRSELRITPVS